MKNSLWMIGLLVLFGCNKQEATDNNSAQTAQSTFDYGQDIEAMIASMSIEQKVGQMTQINIDVVSKGEVFNLVEPHELDPDKLDKAINTYFVGSFLNVGGHTYTREHWQEIITAIQHKSTNEGVKIPMLYGIDAIHGVNYTIGGTLFPQEIGQAATWNPQLVHDAAAITAYECRASGIPWTFSPVLDLGRSPLWSRFFETYGEDVHLAKTMAQQCIIGYQGADPSHPEKVAACLKHFLGYSMPLSGKDRTPAWIPERQMREYFLPTFEAAIREGALTLMINSGEMNGIPVHADPQILTNLLRNELGFKGIALTDWEDIIKLYRDHKVATDTREAVKIAVMAGVDMSMTPNDYSFNDALIDLVKKGEVPESRLDESCRRILWVKKQLGLLEHPLVDFDAYPKFGSAEFAQVAYKTAVESMTLLKNEEQVLPLPKDAKVLVCGPAAQSLTILNGAWTHTWQGVDPQYNTKGAKTIVEALQSRTSGKIEYVEGSSLSEEVSIAQALSVAKRSDYVVVCIGEVPCTEKPGDIEDLALPQAQRNLVKALHATGKPIVMVMVLNRPRIVADIEPLCKGIVHAYLPGDQGGEAIAAVLYGDENPSGKLPFTYPRASGSLVPYDHKYTEKLDVNFGSNAFQPQWEFGAGGSYSTFDYQQVTLDKALYKAGDTIRVSVALTNTSTVPGKEVVQVYVSDEVASITPSVKRLRAFQKVHLEGGAQQNITCKIPVSELAFVDQNNQWVVEKGVFWVTVHNTKQKFIIE